jgi:hypothetical protein
VPKESVRISVSPRSGKSETRGMRSEIESVCVYGYKSIAKPCTVSIAPLTLLAGANSSGKSSLLQPILLIKQTLEATFDPGPLLLNGPNAKFTSADQLFALGPQKTPVRSFGIRFSLSDERMLELKFNRRSTQLGLDVQRTVVTDPALGIENLAISPKLSPAAIDALQTLPSPFAGLKRGSAPLDWDVSTRRCFLEVLEVFEEGDRRYGFPSPVNDLVQEVEALVGQVIHLPGLRGSPVRTHPRTAPGSSTYPGQFQDYVASIVLQWQEEKGDSKLQGVASDLEELGLTWRVEAVAIDDTRIELRVGRLPHIGRRGEKDLLNLADVGLGTSQILPVLVALRVAEPGQLVLLEQPEIHLHPRAQSALAGILVRAALRGVRVVAETHSSLLLRGVQTLIARDEIPQGLVGLNWITRNQSTGSSSVTTASVDEFGRFGDWPEDFDEVTLRAEKNYLDAVEDRYAKW